MVKRWDIITVGNLSRNRYWGEDESKPVRPALCTCTLVTDGRSRLLVDPSCAEAERMAAELDRRSGLTPADITHVFVTHEHGDHHAGLRHFPQAHWLAAPDVAAAINSTGRYGKAVLGVLGEFLSGLSAIPTPGHTMTHHSVRFECREMTIVVAGDAVMTRDFFAERRGFCNSVDFIRASHTIRRLAKTADIVVPGHDNYLLTSLRADS